jgi:hypothetical protein
VRRKNKECPFKIDYVEKGLSSTSFELSVANEDFYEVTMFDLLLFVQA